MFGAFVGSFPALISGILLTVSFPNVHLPWLSWIALTPLLLSIRKKTPQKAFQAGFITGGIHFFSLLYWIVPTISTYGQLPILLAVPILVLFSFYLGLYPAVFALIVNRFHNVMMPLIAATTWAALEYVRAVAFTGFPWGLLGSTQYKTLPLIQIADITSVYGISFIIVLTNGVLTVILQRFNDNRRHRPNFRVASVCWVGALTALFAVVLIYGAHRISQIEKIAAATDHMTIAVVQGNISQDLKWEQAYQEATISKYCELSSGAMTDPPDSSEKTHLIVWPETAMPFYYGWNKELSFLVDRCIDKAGTSFLVGSPAFERFDDPTAYELFNRAYMVNPNGFVTGHYDKIHLVPFGEYVPLGQYLFFLGKIIAQAGDFSPGAADSRPLAFNGSHAGVLICFELIFPYLSRNVALNGAEILINTTNDAWFGRTSAPEQHFSMGVFRAIENRRALARSANTGISGFIDPTGAVAKRSDLFKATYLTHHMPAMTLRTVYMIWGDLFAKICLLVTGVMAIAMALPNVINILKNRHRKLPVSTKNGVTD